MIGTGGRGDLCMPDPGRWARELTRRSTSQEPLDCFLVRVGTGASKRQTNADMPCGGYILSFCLSKRQSAKSTTSIDMRFDWAPKKAQLILFFGEGKILPNVKIFQRMARDFVSGLNYYGCCHILNRYYSVEHRQYMLGIRLFSTPRTGTRQAATPFPPPPSRMGSWEGCGGTANPLPRSHVPYVTRQSTPLCHAL